MKVKGKDPKGVTMIMPSDTWTDSSETTGLLLNTEAALCIEKAQTEKEAFHCNNPEEHGPQCKQCCRSPSDGRTEVPMLDAASSVFYIKLMDPSRRRLCRLRKIPLMLQLALLALAAYVVLMVILKLGILLVCMESAPFTSDVPLANMTRNSTHGLLSSILEKPVSNSSSDGRLTYNYTTVEDFHEPISDLCWNIEDDQKQDCFPDDGTQEAACLARGCCWKPASGANETTKLPPLGVPYCYYPTDYLGYEVISIQHNITRISAILRRKQPSGFPKDITELRMDIINYNEGTLRIKITDKNEARYEVPVPTISNLETKRKSLQYEVKISMSGNLEVIRRATGKTIFQTNVSTLVYADQLIQLGIKLPSEYVYGLGEHLTRLKLGVNWERYTMFNRDQAPVEEKSLYGSHPFYLVMEDDGNSHGVLLFNSNAMDVILQPAPLLTFRSTGGIVDLFVYLGPSPMDVVRQHTGIVGLPFMPPYWSLGFHLCRFGNPTLNRTKKIWNQTRDAGIPFDVQWNDLDYMNSSNEFTYNQTGYSGLPEFVEELHSLGMHYMVIIEPGISNAEPPGTYPPYDEGVSLDIFVKNITGQIFIGKVWNAVSTVFIDFTNLKSLQYWTDQFRDFQAQVAFDGAWIDMNEPSNFLDGQIDGCPANSSLEYPPYVPAGVKLSTRTLCMTCQQAASVHYNIHNIYGLTETIVTNVALSRVRNLRPFIISRSTFPGQGHFGGHWTGDVHSDWNQLKLSIPGILNFNMFGIPMVGADICGFDGNTTVELCARWSSLGAFYPFSRNHNSDGCIDQDPVSLGPTVVSAAKKALTTRYFLLPYLYTLFFRSHQEGDPVARPLFFEYPLDRATYTIDTQFLWGPALMILPALDPNVTSITAYFPADTWYDFYTGNMSESQGQNYTLPAPIDSINLAIRGGYILPVQEPNVTTTESRNNPFHLLVALNKAGEAHGELFWDDGDSLDTVPRGDYNLINFYVMKSKLSCVCGYCGYQSTMTLKTVTIMGVLSEPVAVTANGKPAQFEYSAHTKVLTVKQLALSLQLPVYIIWN